MTPSRGVYSTTYDRIVQCSIPNPFYLITSLTYPLQFWSEKAFETLVTLYLPHMSFLSTSSMERRCTTRLCKIWNISITSTHHTFQITHFPNTFRITNLLKTHLFETFCISPTSLLPNHHPLSSNYLLEATAVTNPPSTATI